MVIFLKRLKLRQKTENINYFINTFKYKKLKKLLLKYCLSITSLGSFTVLVYTVNSGIFGTPCYSNEILLYSDLNTMYERRYIPKFIRIDLLERPNKQELTYFHYHVLFLYNQSLLFQS